ncbi:unnamed protein product, partial [Brenthis ino]
MKQTDKINIKELNSEEIEKYITEMTKTIQKACDETLRPKRNSIDRVPWWTPKLEEHKKEVIKLHHRLQDLVKGRKPIENILKEREEAREKSENIKIIYEHVIEPIVTYAAGIWGEAVKYKVVRDTLTSMQRLFALQIIRAFRTVSANAAIALATLKPLHLKVGEVAAKENTKKIKTCKFLPEDIRLDEPAHHSKLLHPAHRTTIQIIKVNNQEELNIATDNINLKIYTDGSKLDDGRVGAAFVVFKPDGTNIIKKYKLHTSCSVFQAELLAIHKSIKWATTEYTSSNIAIISDSLSGLNAIADSSNTNQLIVKIHDDIKAIREEKGKVIFCWVKSHTGIAGNEAADTSAKSAAASHQPLTFDRFPLSYVKHRLAKETEVEANEIYRNSLKGIVTKNQLPNLNIINELWKVTTPTFELTQFLTGHGYHLEYLKRFKIKTTNICPCSDREIQTQEHLIKICPRYNKFRIDHQINSNNHNMENPYDIKELIEKKECMKTYLKLIKNIIRTLKEYNNNMNT